MSSLVKLKQSCVATKQILKGKDVEVGSQNKTQNLWRIVGKLLQFSDRDRRNQSKRKEFIFSLMLITKLTGIIQSNLKKGNKMCFNTKLSKNI